MEGFEAIPPQELHEWLESAQNELSTAIDLITSVLEVLPPLLPHGLARLNNAVARWTPQEEAVAIELLYWKCLASCMSKRASWTNDEAARHGCRC